MRARPDGIDDADVIAAVSLEWGVQATGCVHAPVGGGSHHWRIRAGAIPLWVTIDDLADKPFLGGDAESVFEALTAALEAARALRSAGLDFVAAPLATVAGRAVARLGARYAIALYELLDGESYAFGHALDESTADQLAQALGRLHSASATAPGGARPLSELLPNRPDLEGALAQVDLAWEAGPYSERARDAVLGARRRIEGKLRLFDEMAAGLTRSAPSVLTHGEPHPGNLMRVAGRLVLVDWDTLALAPPERDLWWLDSYPRAVARYERAAGLALRPDAMRLFGLRWELDDIASFVRIFRAPHVIDADTERWMAFASRL